ncbi:MAG: ABC transporter substrate-binding protein [Alphaproteobacteria bacterium GM202ARS2]|nr:ABC transporter substrate-binding protein [Alphaproteobacteria bacterium GM202ARS2]
MPVYAGGLTIDEEKQSLRPARAVVGGLYDGLRLIMKKGQSLGFKGRLTHIESVLQRAFHFPLMASVAAGRIWQQGTVEQQETFVKVFTDFSAATYASNFASEKGGVRFSIVDSFFLGDSVDRARVNSRLDRKDGDPVRLDYAMRRFGEQWRIIDVFLDGKASELALRRSQYRAVDTTTGGLADLTAYVRAAVDKIKADQDEPLLPAIVP